MPMCAQPRGPTGPRLVGPPPTHVQKGGLPGGTWSLIFTLLASVGLILAVAAFGIVSAINSAHGQEAKRSRWEQYSCETVRDYLKSHTEEEARAFAKELRLPRWLIRKAEACPRK